MSFLRKAKYGLHNHRNRNPQIYSFPRIGVDLRFNVRGFQLKMEDRKYVNYFAGSQRNIRHKEIL